MFFQIINDIIHYNINDGNVLTINIIDITNQI